MSESRAAPETERERAFHEQMWAYGKNATVAYVRIDGAWHPTQPYLPLPANCDGFSWKGPGVACMTNTWGGHHDWP